MNSITGKVGIAEPAGRRKSHCLTVHGAVFTVNRDRLPGFLICIIRLRRNLPGSGWGCAENGAEPFHRDMGS